MIFFETHQDQLIQTGYVLVILIFIRFITNLIIKKVGKKRGIYKARIKLICRYVTVTLFLIAVLIEAYILGAEFKELAVIFSSVFAIVGIGLFAVWSILSNITSGIIMFFNFPYKVGDKIMIHDSDFPTESIIEDIRAFHLHLRLDNGNLVTYPNSLILQKAVTLIKKDALK